jgi:tetratricopeptide (TPR) repeat protein
LLLRELEQNPENAFYLFQLALEYSSLGRTQNAFQCLQKAFDLTTDQDPFAPNVVVDYLYAIIEMKQYDLGMKVIQETSRFVDDFPDFHFVRGLFYMNLVRSDPARYISFLPMIEGSYRRCLALGETEKYKSVRGTGSFLAEYNLGTFYQVFDNRPAALECFKRAARQGYEPAARML